MVLGELALDGRVRPVRGVLPAVLAAKGAGWGVAVVPVENLPEASLVDGIEVWGVRTLAQLLGWLERCRRVSTSGSAERRRRRSRPRTWPTWWGRPRPGSRSRWPLPVRIT